MNLLVCGGAGYIGSVVGARLLEEGHAVTVADSLVTGHEDAVPEAHGSSRSIFSAVTFSTPRLRSPSLPGSHPGEGRLYSQPSPSLSPMRTLNLLAEGRAAHPNPESDGVDDAAATRPP